MAKYTDNEKQLTSFIERPNLKKFSKNDTFNVLGFTSKFNELNSEVAKQVLEQYPEFINLVKSTFNEQTKICGEIIESDNESTNHVYSIMDREIESNTESRKLCFECGNNFISELSKFLDDPNITQEERKDILEKQMETLHMMYEKDTEIRESEKEVLTVANEKDSEKKAFDWKIISTVVGSVTAAVLIGTGVFNGKIKLKLPRR
ncbi:MAG: hypothetical protein NC253_03285 [Ruminococcus sp.]|nr:hypothetical protein [Ruminococcus sp.]MCM1480117.1 hypothetical protein [Muribaculaceae bacterium]